MPRKRKSQLSRYSSRARIAKLRRIGESSSEYSDRLASMREYASQSRARKSSAERRSVRLAEQNARSSQLHELQSSAERSKISLKPSPLSSGPSTSASSSTLTKGSKKQHGGRQTKKRKVFDPSCDGSATSEVSPDGFEQAGPGAPARKHPCCCCCLSVEGDVTLAGSGHADKLSDCFDIVYPAELIATASICWDCVEKLDAGVQFKRRALECQSTLASCHGTGVIPYYAENAASSATYDVTYEEGNEIIHEEYDLCTDGEHLAFADDEPVNANEYIQAPLFTEASVNEEALVLHIVEKQTIGEQKFFQDGCECGKNCHKIFSRFEVIAFRRECEKYRTESKCDTNHLDIFLTGALACTPDRSMTANKFIYKFRGFTVCQEFFMFVFALNTKQCNNIVAKIVDKSIYQSSNQSITDQPDAIKFLKVYSLQNSLILPGRLTNRHPDLHILPKHVTKSTIYSEYAKVCVAAKKTCINQTIFDKLWERFCPYIVHKLPSDLCKICRENTQRLSEVCLLRKGLYMKKLERCLGHLQLVKDESAFHKRVMAPPVVNDGTLHCSIDFLQRLRLPYEPAAGPLNFLDAYGVALFAVACPPPGGTVVYVVPERVGDDSMNITLSLLHHFLESESHADVQCHCGPLLRADRVLQYAAWRGARAGRCRLAFLPPGHDTRVDCLGVLKPALRSRPARRVQELCDVLAATGLTAVPVATETGDLNVPIYDWLAYFDERNPAPVSGIQNYCHFEANSSCSGVIKCKVSVMSDTSDDLFVFNKSLVGEPDVLPPAELSAERRKYLTEKVQPHLEENEGLIELKVEPVDDEVQDPLEFIKEEIKMEFEEHYVG